MTSYYDLANYDDEEERENNTEHPDFANLCAAASYIGQLLTSRGCCYAAQGGFAMACRGSARTTWDVDIATDASMRQLWEMMEPEKGQVLPRLMIPNTRLLDKVIRIFVRTGPSHGDSFCSEDKTVEVDLNVFGTKSGDAELAAHVEEVQVVLQGHTFHINVLDVFYMMRTKLRTLTARGAGRDFDDVMFLLDNEGTRVKASASKLDLEDRVHFVETDAIQGQGPTIVKRYSELLDLL